MNDPAKSDGGAFDLDQLRELIEMMEKHGLSEVELQHGEQQWKLKRGATEITAVPMPQNFAMPAAAPVPAAPAAPAESSSNEDAGLIDIKSPTVGTFYSSPSPDDPPFVKEGSAVKPDTVVCLLEAMKVFNQIPAECSGVIEKILVSDGDAIEFGQALFKVRPG